MKDTIPYITMLFLLSIGFWACDKADPVPAYIQVNTFIVSTNYPTQGSNSAKVTDVWIYNSGQLLGVYELPARVPILAEGPTDLTLSAGIENNGINDTRVAYPLYKSATATANFSETETVIIDTVNVSYFPGLQYTWFEDFEGAGFSLDTLSSSKGDIALDNSNAFEGNGCMLMEVDTAQDIIECVSVNAFPIPAGRKVYLEMNYQCDQEFVVGIRSTYATGIIITPVILLRQSLGWNKIYIELSKTINANSTATGHQVYFYFPLEEATLSGKVYLDNLKLIYQ